MTDIDFGSIRYREGEEQRVYVANSVVKKLTDNDFHAAIQKGVFLVDFFAEWCPPCRIIAPILDDIAKEMHDKVAIYKLDIEESFKVVEEFQVTSFPTLILFKDGSEINRVIGARDKSALVKFISECNQ